mgnify:CR=1 FL=1
MKSLYLSVLMLLVGCGWGGTQSTLPTGQITVNGLERSYRFYIPENLPSGPRPLLLSQEGVLVAPSIIAAVHAFRRAAREP